MIPETDDGKLLIKQANGVFLTLEPSEADRIVIELPITVRIAADFFVQSGQQTVSLFLKNGDAILLDSQWWHSLFVPE